VVSAGVITDLRLSRRLQDATAWRAALDARVPGLPAMPRFHDFITTAQADAIRSYVAGQAAALYASEQTSR
jgi:hypothetical protein